MRIHTKVVYEWNDNGELVVVHEEGYEFEGTPELCKGDSTAKDAEKQQLAFNASLMNIFQSQFGQQSQIFNYLKGKLSPIIDDATGMSKEAEAAARTSNTDQFSASYQNAQKALNAKMAASGESTLPSGVGAQLNEALLNAEAADKATGQNQITMQNEQLKQQNYWNAIGALSGQQAQLNPLGYANSATAGSGAVSNLSQAVTASSGPTFGSILGGAVGGVVGAAGQAGGFGKLFGCFVVAKTFGGNFYSWLDPRTIITRNYLLNDFGQRWYGRGIIKLYVKYGESISRRASLMKILKPLVYVAFNQARKAECSSI